MPVDVARLRVDSAKHRIDKFIELNIQQWAEDEVLSLAVKYGWDKGLASHVTQEMWIETSRSGNKIYVDVFWNYRGPNDEPISLFLEKGVKAHEIWAKGELFGGADILSWVGKDGKRVFRPKVNHPGYGGMFIMKRAHKDGMKSLKKRINRETDKMLEMTRIG